MTHPVPTEGREGQRHRERIGMSDWTDDEMDRRNRGVRRALDQDQHRAINARHFPGTRQLCGKCSEPTGHCEEDSLYIDDDGPLCETCYAAAAPLATGGAKPEREGS